MILWTKAAIAELDRQRDKHHLSGDQPLGYLTEKMVATEGGHEVHAADVRLAGDRWGASIKPWPRERPAR